MVEVGTS